MNAIIVGSRRSSKLDKALVHVVAGIFVVKRQTSAQVKAFYRNFSKPRWVFNNIMAASAENVDLPNGGKKHILLNAFDMSTIGHLSPGQWKVSTNSMSEREKLLILRIRTPKTNLLRSEISSIGLSSPNCWRGEGSMRCSLLTLMVAMIRTKDRLTTASGELHNGQ